MKLFNKFDIDLNFDLDAIESYIAARLRIFIAAAVALLAFTVLIALTVFFIALRGAEQTMVPDVKGKELTLRPPGASGQGTVSAHPAPLFSTARRTRAQSWSRIRRRDPSSKRDAASSWWSAGVSS